LKGEGLLGVEAGYVGQGGFIRSIGKSLLVAATASSAVLAILFPPLFESWLKLRQHYLHRLAMGLGGFALSRLIKVRRCNTFSETPVTRYRWSIQQGAQVVSDTIFDTRPGAMGLKKLNGLRYKNTRHAVNRLVGVHGFTLRGSLRME
jgi:hypothetical protein